MAPLQDPRTKYSAMNPPEQLMDEPGLDRDLEPKADRGEKSYRGSGRLKGRKALITGGDSGIGAAVAIAFAREGADVAIAHLPAEQADAQEISRLIQEAGQRSLTLEGDLSELAFCEEVVAKTVDAFGGLDILVNNASRQVWQERPEDVSDEQFDLTMRTNIYSAFRVTRAALPHLEAGSSIIFSTSVQAYDPNERLLDYAITKSGINSMSKGLAQALAPRGIRVNAVAPGPIWTPLQPSHGQPQSRVQEFGQGSPFGRAGQPAELAGAYVYLASDEASYTSGETLGVTGGRPTP